MAFPTFLEKQVHPSQLFGLETNVYAQELASVVVWIGYLQWLNEHAIGWPTEPILRKLDNIQHRDAILTHDAEGKPVRTRVAGGGLHHRESAVSWGQENARRVGRRIRRCIARTVCGPRALEARTL